MIEFNWELNKILIGIKKGLLERQTSFFLRPHDAIWGDTSDDFISLADSIMALLLSRAMVIFHFSMGWAKVICHPQGQVYLPF